MSSEAGAAALFRAAPFENIATSSLNCTIFRILAYCAYFLKRETHDQEIIVRHLVAQFLFWHYIVACGEGDGPHFRMTKHSHGVAGRSSNNISKNSRGRRQDVKRG